MSKLLKVKQDGSFFTMSVEHDSGHREKWMYERRVTADGVCYSQVDREDIK